MACNGDTFTFLDCIFGFKGASTSQVIGARNEMRMDDYDGQMIFGDLGGGLKWFRVWIYTCQNYIIIIIIIIIVVVVVALLL